jgi:hypothetical protein
VVDVLELEKRGLLQQMLAPLKCLLEDVEVLKVVHDGRQVRPMPTGCVCRLEWQRYVRNINFVVAAYLTSVYGVATNANLI